MRTSFPFRARFAVAALAIVAAAGPAPGRAWAQTAASEQTLHGELDTLLDANVRDGLVYYGALRAARTRLSRYVDSLDAPSIRSVYGTWAPAQQASFWVNAYNAFVLLTVVDRYPIRGTAPQYPSDSIRQIPGAFDQRTFRAAGREVTLDAIEETILPGFDDPRLFLALGRGAVGSPRLRSEAFTAARLESQLASIVEECAGSRTCITVEPVGERISVTPVIGWHEAAFVRTYAGEGARFAPRSPIERVVLHLIEPRLFQAEHDMLLRDRFTVEYREFDWRLNDLSSD